MRGFVLLLLSMFLISFAYAQTTVEYYHGLGCSHCQKVQDSGVLEKINQTILVQKYEVWYDVQNQDKFSKLVDKLNVPSNDRGVPFLLINCSGNITYLVGDTPIIQNAESYATTCNFTPKKVSNNNIFWWIVIALIITFFIVYFLKHKLFGIKKFNKVYQGG